MTEYERNQIIVDKWNHEKIVLGSNQEEILKGDSFLEMLEIMNEFAAFASSPEEARVMWEPNDWEPMLRTHGLMPRYREDEEAVDNRIHFEEVKK